MDLFNLCTNNVFSLSCSIVAGDPSLVFDYIRNVQHLLMGNPPKKLCF